MTCGMLCVMRRERRGVLHLDKYSPPKEICSGERGEKKGKNKKKKKEIRKTTENERESVVLRLTNRGVASVNRSALREVGVLSNSG